MKSIYLRNFTVMAALVLMCFILVAFSFLSIGRMYLIQEFRSDMTANAKEVSRLAFAISEDDSGDEWLLSMSLSAIASSSGNQIFITDTDGVITCCSDKTPVCRHLGIRISQDCMDSLCTDDCFELTDLGGIFGEKRYVVTAPIPAAEAGPAKGFVIVAGTQSSVLGNWSTFLLFAAGATVVVLLISLALSLMYSKRMAKPFDEMAAASRKFARGDFSVRVKQEEDTSDELGALIDSFNKMADSLESAEERRSEFIANISHELRTPMTTIAGFADGILDGTIPQEEEKKYLVSIRDETRRLSRLVREMLDASQTKAHAADPRRRTVFDITELVIQTLLSFESRATSKKLDVDPQLPENLIPVLADKDAITRVIYNLLDNAVKFAREGSCLTVRVYKEGDKAFVSVRNEGETIPPDDLPFIFDRFHKSDRSRSVDKDGVGLGLYLVKSIINSHDEDIAVKSEDGVTEFTFTLRLAEK